MNQIEHEFEFLAKGRPILQVVVDSAIETEQALMELFSRSLSFPDYFGWNWNAMLDLVSDLFWLDATEVVIVHPSLPQLPREELRLYLTLLLASLERRTAEDVPRLRVVFSQDDRETVRTLLSDYVSVEKK